MQNLTRNISKELYDIAMANKGRIPEDKEEEVFGGNIVWGYGLYGTKVRKDGDAYVVDYTIGSTCD